MTRKRFLGVLVVLSLAAVVAGVCPGQAQGAMYFDDFSGLSSANLPGTTPDITPTGTETWTGSNNWKANGYQGNWWDGSFSAALPFTPDSGKVYTLSAVIDVDPLNNEPYHVDHIGINFGGGPGLSFQGFGSGQYGTGTGRVDTSGPLGSVNEGNYGSGAISIDIVLDTQPALWTVEWFVNDVSVRGPEAYAANPTITNVTIWTDWMSGSVDDLTLTPEPATLSLLLLGGLAMLRRRRAA